MSFIDSYCFTLVFCKSVPTKVLHLQGESWKQSDNYRFLINQVNLPLHGRVNNGPFKCFSQSYLHSPTICHGMETQDLFLFFFLTSRKWARYIDCIMLTCEDLPLLKDTENFYGTSIRERMDSEPTENSRLKHHNKVFGSHFIRYDACCPRSYD